MARTLYTATGTPLNIGRELGKGGEGSVFEVPSLGGQVSVITVPDGIGVRFDHVA